jgi:hypothetical protein
VVQKGQWLGTTGQLYGSGQLEVVGVLRMECSWGDSSHATSLTIIPGPPAQALADHRWSNTASPLSAEEFAYVWAALLRVRCDWSDWHSYVATVGKGDYGATERVCFDATSDLYRAVWAQIQHSTGEREDEALASLLAGRSESQWRAEGANAAVVGAGNAAATLAGLNALRSASSKLDCLVDWVKETASSAPNQGADDLLPLLVHSMCVSELRCPRAHLAFIENLRDPQWREDFHEYCFVLYSSCVVHVASLMKG